MQPYVKPLALFGVAAAVSLTGWWIAAPEGSDARTASLLSSPARSFGLSTRYELEDLDLASTTLDEIEVEYVDPQRVNYEVMFEAALDAIERRVPTVLFRRVEGSRLIHVQVGDHRTVVEVEALESAGDLKTALRTIVGEVADHVDPDDVRVEEGDEPLAAIEYALVNGMLDTLDPHSRLLPPEDSREMDVENSGEFGGLGISIVERQGQLVVDYPMPDTPAAEAGLRADDRIVRIDGEATINMGLDEAVKLLRGAVGSEVILTIERDAEPEPIDVPIVRDRIKMNPVEGDVLDGGVGVVVIPAFHANVAADLEATLTRLAREVPGGRLKGLILDLRGNPGGYLNQAVSVADRFLEDGTIVSTMRRGTEDDREEARAPRTEPRYPIAVLVSASSASASEIVAGALRNNDRAVIVGERSFGKGSVQNLEPYFDGSKLKLTIAQYYTPGEKSIQAVGIPADFELVPAVIQEGEGEASNVALLYWRERVRREGDFDAHLERQLDADEKPVYSVPYLRPQDLRRKDSSLVHLRGDPEVRFARDVLIASGGRFRRSEILRSGASVVSTYRTAGERDIERAFQGLGVDWSLGPGLEGPNLEVALDLGEDGQLVAGESETVWLEVTNRGDAPVHRLAAVSTSDAEILDGREFFFGRLEPGETLRYAQHVVLNDGYPTEHTPVTFTFRDAGSSELFTWEARLPVEGRSLPRLGWSWTADDRAGGDGDGMLEVGETVEIALDITNHGEGPATEAFARVKNRSHKALDILRGTLEPGFMRDEDGQPCEVLVGGIDGGNVVHGPEEAAEESARRVADGEPPEWAEGCSRSLEAGETWSGRLSVDLREASEVWQLELSVGDARAYDHATVMRAGFYDTFADEALLELTADAAKAGGSSEPPAIEITRMPESVVTRDHVTLSGMVRDAGGIAHVTVWHGDEKVALANGADLPAIPFSADIALKPGLNTLAVIATDSEGLVHTRSVVTSYEPPEVQARAEPDEAP